VRTWGLDQVEFATGIVFLRQVRQGHDDIGTKEGCAGVSILLGHSSVRITGKHYASRVQARHDILRAHLAKVG